MKTLEPRVLHIVSFAIPYPPDYGGVIEVYHKMAALHRAGIRIRLHAFAYGGRSVSPELEAICEEVHIYPRRMDWKQAAGTTPFIITSRKSETMMKRLLADQHPVLLEGMHTGSVLGDPRLKGRVVLLRMHNIEWDYYRHLATHERSWFRKAYLTAEAWKLERSRDMLHHADKVLVISSSELLALKREFPQSVLLPAFHGFGAVRRLAARGEFALYHGNLSVPENRKAAEWLMEEVFDQHPVPLVIAGASPPPEWKDRWPDVEIIADPSAEKMEELIARAHLHVLPAFQSTGVKLKLLHALFRGRHCLVNPAMVAGTGLEMVCHIGDSAGEMKAKVDELWEREVRDGEWNARKNALDTHYNDDENARKLIQWIYSPRA